MLKCCADKSCEDSKFGDGIVIDVDGYQMKQNNVLKNMNITTHIWEIVIQSLIATIDLTTV